MKYFFPILGALAISIACLTRCQAATDVTLQLTTTDGSSVVSVQNSSAVEVSSITSQGDGNFRVVKSSGGLQLGNTTVAGNQPICIWLTNSSGGALTQGALVIIGTSDNSFTTTTTASVTSVLGVVYDASIANGAVGRIAIGGVAIVTAAAATTRGQHVISSTSAGQAGTTATPTSGASIGVWLQTLGSAGNGLALLRH